LKKIYASMIPERSLAFRQYSLRRGIRTKMGEHMRRVLSILLVALLGFAPLSALASSSGSTRLPVCCRKRGVHHCEMPEDAAARIVAAISGSTATVGAPARCPQYPGAQNATLTPVFVLAPRSAVRAATQSSERIYAAIALSASLDFFNAHAVRGPPAAVLA
jgi:hypothetical protein